jgi:hypothetical protein
LVTPSPLGLSSAPRTADGCVSAQTLLAKIRAQCCQGSELALRRWLIKLRGAIAEPGGRYTSAIAYGGLLSWRKTLGG